MKLSYNWLSEYVDLRGITPQELAAKMTAAGLEVEGLEQPAQGTNLIVGRVLSCQNHPDSDHLHVCTVDIGQTVLQIVCGAPNVAKDQKVIVARPGAVLPEITIKEGMIRGVASQGMICALFELGVDKKQLSEAELSGITVLPETAVIGDANPLGLLGLDDVILDVSLTPNRADCLAMWAMAKEVGAIVRRTVTLPECAGQGAIGRPGTLKIASTTDKCQRFIGKVVNHITIKPSPDWLKKALNSVGIKSINNVVDISNYVMMETGQPLHFYDLAKIPAKEITVVDDLDATYTALDGIAYPVKPGDIMITTRNQAIGIAGIMGGDDSKIEATTRGIIIEAAIFDLAAIRNTSRRLNLATEASIHFQKGIEPLAPLKAVDRAIQLLLELADAKDIEASVVLGDFAPAAHTITIDTGYINTFLSTQFSDAAIIDTFRALDLDPVADGSRITVTIPSYRTDLNLPVDLCEEVIRLLGYDSVPLLTPSITECVGQLAVNEDKRYLIRDILRAKGAAEIVSYSLVGARQLACGIMPIGKPVTLTNPLSEDRKYYRTSLIPSMLDVAAYNMAHYSTQWSLFEIGNVYADDGSSQERLAMAISREITVNKWAHRQVTGDFYLMKGRISGLLAALGFADRRISFQAGVQDTVLHPYQSAIVYLDKQPIGCLGTIHPQAKNQLSVGDCTLAELDLSALYAAKPAKVHFNPLGKYPSVNLDLALIVDDDVKAEAMVQTIKKAGGRLVTDVEVFDVYRGANLEAGKKSLAFSITYQSLDKTLTDQDIRPHQEEIIATLAKRYQAVLRDS